MASIAPRLTPTLQSRSVHEEHEESRDIETFIPLGTSKEWNVPPRPKPGRKPRCDVNPDKRKIQNRVAQKLFRERKAARTDILSEQRKELEGHFRTKEAAHLQTLHGVRREKNKLEQRVSILEKEIRMLQSIALSDDGQRQMVSPASSPGNTNDPHTPRTFPPESERCGICSSLEECICANSTELGTKRAPSPFLQHATKRNKQSALEIDFTGAFAKPTRSVTHSLRNTLQRKDPHDPCGFCSIGTPCICNDEYATSPLSSDTLPPLLKGSVSGSSEAQNKPEALHPGPTIACCGSNYEPGSCAQCKADPMSTLFCQTLAQHTGRQRDGKCGSDRNRSCSISQIDSSSDLYIPCSAAYQTLSRHQGFSNTNLASVVSGLSRRGCEVEVGSVQHVLKELDKKLYS